MPEANLPPPRHSTSLEKWPRAEQNLFDKRCEMVFLSAVENENHDDFNSEAFAGGWTHVHLAAQLLRFWRRGWERIRKRNRFSRNPRLPVNRGFSVCGTKPMTKGTT
jgi:hypothetical protein